ncbi:MAG: hypothetical protein ACREC5_04195 [Thermoplasmata archaeon]
MAVGKAIDGTLSQFGYLVGIGRKPTATALRRLAESLLDDGLAEAAAEISPSERERVVRQIEDVVRAYRTSPIFGLSRPKTRVILIDDRVGVYAQPDYWDGRGRFFEMKSYPAIPPPPDVALQLRLFQLAFPGFESRLVCLNRHAHPVETTSTVVAPPSSEEAHSALRLAYDLGIEFGEEKVFEYMEGPFVRYALGPGPVP